MSGMPYVADASQATRVLAWVRRATTPRAVTPGHLAANGFEPAAAEQVCAFLHALGLVDADDSPTDRWTSYRDADDPDSVLRDLMAEHYGPLLDTAAAGPTSTASLEQLVDPLDPEATTAPLVVATFRALARQAGVAVDTAADDRRPRRDVLRDVSDLLQRSVTEFETARLCLAGDLPRPAHVAAWNSVVALGFAHLSADDFAALRTSGRRRTLPLDELVRVVHGGELIRLLVKHEVVPADGAAVFEELLRARDDCVHPLTTGTDRTAAATYLSSILSLSAQLTEHHVV